MALFYNRTSLKIFIIIVVNTTLAHNKLKFIWISSYYFPSPANLICFVFYGSNGFLNFIFK